MPRLDNVLHGAEIVASKGTGDIIAEVEDLDNIDEFHSVGIGRFKLTEVGQYLLYLHVIYWLSAGGPGVCGRPAEADHDLAADRRGG